MSRSWSESSSSDVTPWPWWRELSARHLGHDNLRPAGHAEEVRPPGSSENPGRLLPTRLAPAGRLVEWDGVDRTHTKINDDGSYSFRIWDYGQKCERDATEEEIHNHISWSTHT